MLVSEITREIRPDSLQAVLSGPTFAHEVARGQPAAVTLACQTEALWDDYIPAPVLAAFPALL